MTPFRTKQPQLESCMSEGGKSIHFLKAGLQIKSNPVKSYQVQKEKFVVTG